MVEHSVTNQVEEEVDLLKRTIRILSVVKEEQPIGIKMLSKKLDLKEGEVRYSLRLLEKENIINPTAAGATLTEKHEEFEEVLLQDLKDIKETLVHLIETVSR